MSRGFDASLAALTRGHPPRVWSLLVTVFGDLGQANGARFSGGLLGRITDTIGIKPEATRVALHRLRKEGWITSQRNGRRSDHVVTQWGRVQITQASPRIYAPGQLTKRAYLIVVAPGARDPDGVVLRPGLCLSDRPATDGDAFCQDIDLSKPLPDWMQARVLPPELLVLAKDTSDRLKAAQMALPDPDALTALQTAVLRVLTVHAWRRVALRVPILPDAVLPDTYQGPIARAATMDLLARLKVPPLADLEDDANGQAAA